MNSYGDPNPGFGRAQVSGSNGGYDYAHEPDRQGGSGAAGVGRASVGRATVSGSGGYAYDDGPANGSNGSYGSNGAPVGRASVGRAAVPGAAAGRASVRPVSPPGAPVSPGRGPGGSNRPGGPGGPGRPGADAAAARAKKNRQRNIIITALAVFIMLTGVGVVGGTWFYDDIQTPEALPVPEASTIFFNDGTSQLAKLGEVNRSIVPISKIPEDVRHAVVSAEDRKFYEHNGVDVQGIVRAAWNNVTGGERQGASTITQQYARHVADMSDISYARKLREAVMANKLEKDYSKDQILEHYLNVVYFGRGAYGIEAAAQTFFGTPVDKLTVEQAAVLAAVIKQPVPEPDGSSKGFDPAYDEAAAKGRWDYVLSGMVEKGWLDAGRRAQLQYPQVQPYEEGKTCAVGCGIDQPTGNVINYVREELKTMGLDLKQGGYQITTSIHPGMQTALEKVIRRGTPERPADPASLLSYQPANLMAAAVAVDPKTGRVLAYYGGENGTGTDYAGYNWDGGKKTGGHPPGSSFKIYTLAAGLKEGISMQSHWDATKTKDGSFPISNAGRTNLTGCKQGGEWCTLAESTIASYNVPFYWLTKEIGVAKVVEAARAAGIRTMWTDDGEAVDLATLKSADVPSKFHYQTGYGQYGVTVLDHANGTATLAARGVYRPAHFVVEVKQKDAKGQWKVTHSEQVKPEERLNQNQVDDITATLQNLPENKLANSRPSGRKTGTWEKYKSTTENAHAWTVGYTPQIATAVWVGNEKGEEAIKWKSSPKSTPQNVYGSGLPGVIWKKFMDEAHKIANFKPERFPSAKHTGDEDHEAANGVSPSPKEKEGGGDNKLCERFPALCPGGTSPSPGDGGGGNDGGGGGWIIPSPEPTIRPRE